METWKKGLVAGAILIIVVVGIVLAVTIGGSSPAPSPTPSTSTPSPSSPPVVINKATAPRTTPPKTVTPIRADMPIWVTFPRSWCFESLLTKRVGNELFCEANAPGTGCNWRGYDARSAPAPAKPKWINVTNKIKTDSGMALMWYAVNSGKCDPFCPLPDRDKVLYDSPGQGCDAVNALKPAYWVSVK